MSFITSALTTSRMTVRDSRIATPAPHFRSTCPAASPPPARSGLILARTCSGKPDDGSLTDVDSSAIPSWRLPLIGATKPLFSVHYYHQRAHGAGGQQRPVPAYLPIKEHSWPTKSMAQDRWWS